jgi:hypothetical protein
MSVRWMCFPSSLLDTYSNADRTAGVMVWKLRSLFGDRGGEIISPVKEPNRSWRGFMVSALRVKTVLAVLLLARILQFG